MTANTDDDGFVGMLVKGAMFSLGAALVQLVLRRFSENEPHIVIVPMPADPSHQTLEPDPADSEE